MKKLLLSLAISGAYFCTYAQPTFDFETWNGTEPSGWISENELMPVGDPQSCFKETTPANVHSGASSMKLLSVTMTTNPGNSLPNPIGLAAPGTNVSFTPKFGMPYTGRPAVVSFWYQYSPVANDTAEFLVTIWNSTTHDTLASGYWKTGMNVTNYTNQNVSLVYNPTKPLTESPDSMALTFSSTALFNPNYTLCMNCGQPGSILWVDDVTFSGWNGINEHPSSNDIITFPNPANEYINIIADVSDAYSVIAYDAMGKKVSSASFNQTINGMNRKEGTLNTSNLSSGLYSYSVLDKSGSVLRAGKFSVAK